jgi:hypothetical protein
MMPTDQPSASTQMVRVCLPSTFMAPEIAAIPRKASRVPDAVQRHSASKTRVNALMAVHR